MQLASSIERELPGRGSAATLRITRRRSATAPMRPAVLSPSLRSLVALVDPLDRRLPGRDGGRRELADRGDGLTPRRISGATEPGVGTSARSSPGRGAPMCSSRPRRVLPSRLPCGRTCLRRYKPRQRRRRRSRSSRSSLCPTTTPAASRRSTSPWAWSSPTTSARWSSPSSSAPSRSADASGGGSSASASWRWASARWES
jgi:hypothetical protein